MYITSITLDAKQNVQYVCSNINIIFTNNLPSISTDD